MLALISVLALVAGATQEDAFHRLKRILDVDATRALARSAPLIRQLGDLRTPKSAHYLASLFGRKSYKNLSTIILDALAANGTKEARDSILKTCKSSSSPEIRLHAIKLHLLRSTAVGI